MNEALNTQSVLINRVSLINFVLPETIKASIQERFIAEQQGKKRKVKAKALATAIKNFQGLLTPQNVINMVSDDRILHLKDPK